MYSALTKYLAAAAITLGTALMASCSGGSGAKDMLDEAQAMLDAGRYADALALTDSLQVAYPSDAAARRLANHLHAKAMEGYTLAEMARVDSCIVSLQLQADTIESAVRTIDVPGSEPYIVVGTDPAATQPLGSATGLQARLSPERQLMLTSTARPPVGHQSVSISASGGQRVLSATVAPDGELNRSTPVYEVVHHTGASADSLGAFVSRNRTVPLTLTFEGGRPLTVELPVSTVMSVAQAYDYHTLYRQLQLLQIERQRLEQQLTVARNQVARTMPEDAQ